MTKYLDLLGLTIYDLAIKLYIDNSTPESITSAEIEELFNNGDIPGGHNADGGGQTPSPFTENGVYQINSNVLGTGSFLVNVCLNAEGVVDIVRLMLDGDSTPEKIAVYSNAAYGASEVDYDVSMLQTVLPVLRQFDNTINEVVKASYISGEWPAEAPIVIS